QGVDLVVAVEMFDHLLEADQRVAVPSVGRWVVDGDQRGVAVLFHGELVGQVEDAGLVGFDSSAHDRPRRVSPRFHSWQGRRGRGNTVVTTGDRACRPAG